MKKLTGFYNSNDLNSYNAVFNFVIGARNLGKTWAFKMRAVMRFVKHGKKTCWVRRFMNEAKKTQQDFLNPKMLEILKLSPDMFKTEGNKVYYKTGPKKWEWFIEIIPLISQQSQKSVDCPDEDTIVFDEFTTTGSKYRMYKGDEVRDLLDLWTTKRRYHEVKCYFLGNKETVTNPYYDYFGIDPLAEEFQGYRRYKKGTIVIQQINDVPDIVATDFEKKVSFLLDGTDYGEYLFGGKIKSVDHKRIKPKPKEATLFVCFDFGHPVSIFKDKAGRMYFNNGIDKTQNVYTDRPREYVHGFILLPKDRPALITIENAYKMHRIFYTSDIAQEQGEKILSYFGIIKS